MAHSPEIPDESGPSNEENQKRNMSLSALSSALSLSSRSESSSQKRKKAAESACDVSNSGSSLSSEGVKSIPQNGTLPPNLLGNPDTDTSSSSGFPSLDLSNSSLSQDHIFMSLSSTSSLSFEHLGLPHTDFETTFHQYEIEAEETNSPASTPERPLLVSRQVVLENVEYFSSLQQAPSSFTDNDLSTIDEPITKEVAKDVFCRRIASAENLDITLSDDATTRHKRHKSAGNHNDEGEFDVEKGKTANATVFMELQATSPMWHRVMDRRTKLELFFMSVIVVSSSALVVLLVVILK